MSVYAAGKLLCELKMEEFSSSWPAPVRNIPNEHPRNYVIMCKQLIIIK